MWKNYTTKLHLLYLENSSAHWANRLISPFGVFYVCDSLGTGMELNMRSTVKLVIDSKYRMIALLRDHVTRERLVPNHLKSLGL